MYIIGDFVSKYNKLCSLFGVYNKHKYYDADEHYIKNKINYKLKKKKKTFPVFGIILYYCQRAMGLKIIIFIMQTLVFGHWYYYARIYQPLNNAPNSGPPLKP